MGLGRHASGDTMSDKSTLRSVVAAIVAGAGVAGALVVASMDKGRDVTADTHVAIFEADEVLRSRGLKEAEIVAEVQRRTGADKAPDSDLVADVVRAAHRPDRDPRTIRSERLVLAVPSSFVGFDAAWGAVYCDPLQPVKDGDSLDLYDACVAAQVGSASAARCVAGSPVGWVVEMQATPALYARAIEALSGTLAGVVEGVPDGWAPCAE